MTDERDHEMKEPEEEKRTFEEDEESKDEERGTGTDAGAGAEEKPTSTKSWRENPIVGVIAVVAMIIAIVSFVRTFKKMTRPRPFDQVGPNVPSYMPMSKGETMPNVKAKDDQGRWLALHDLLKADKNLVIFFRPEPWKHGKAKEMLPLAEKIAEENNVPVIGVFFTIKTYRQARAAIRKLRKESGIKFPILLDVPQGFFSKTDPQSLCCGVDVLGACWYVLGKDAKVIAAGAGGEEKLRAALSGEKPKTGKTKVTPQPKGPVGPGAATKKGDAKPE